MPSLIFKQISATVSIVNLKSRNTAIEPLITSTKQIISFLIYITPTGKFSTRIERISKKLQLWYDKWNFEFWTHYVYLTLDPLFQLFA